MENENIKIVFQCVFFLYISAGISDGEPRTQTLHSQVKQIIKPDINKNQSSATLLNSEIYSLSQTPRTTHIQTIKLL